MEHRGHLYDHIFTVGSWFKQYYTELQITLRGKNLTLRPTREGVLSSVFECGGAAWARARLPGRAYSTNSPHFAQPLPLSTPAPRENHFFLNLGFYCCLFPNFSCCYPSPVSAPTLALFLSFRWGSDKGTKDSLGRRPNFLHHKNKISTPQSSPEPRPLPKVSIHQMRI